MKVNTENMVGDRKGWKGRILVAVPTRVGRINVKTKKRIKYIDTITIFSHLK